MLKLVAVCTMLNFPQFPTQIKGKVVHIGKNFVIIEKYNRTKTQKVEIGFHKSKCKILRR